MRLAASSRAEPCSCALYGQIAKILSGAPLPLAYLHRQRVDGCSFGGQAFHCGDVFSSTACAGNLHRTNKNDKASSHVISSSNECLNELVRIVSGSRERLELAPSISEIGIDLEGGLVFFFRVSGAPRIGRTPGPIRNGPRHRPGKSSSHHGKAQSSAPDLSIAALCQNSREKRGCNLAVFDPEFVARRRELPILCAGARSLVLAPGSAPLVALTPRSCKPPPRPEQC